MADNVPPACGVLTVRFRNYDQLDYVKMRLLGSGQ